MNWGVQADTEMMGRHPGIASLTLVAAIQGIWRHKGREQHETPLAYFLAVKKSMSASVAFSAIPVLPSIFGHRHDRSA